MLPLGAFSFSNVGSTRSAAKTMSEDEHTTVAGIDVGGQGKGFHLVILRGLEIVLVCKSTEPAVLRAHCLEWNVAAVGIDAPCEWSREGVPRSAEHEMAREHISCFATPTEARARANTSGFYGWMFNGLCLYEALAQDYPVLPAKHFNGARAAIETFPHAITCALRGHETTSAKLKRKQRRHALDTLGFDTAQLKSIDDLDAALCAYTAGLWVQGKTRAYGDGAGGYIHVPLTAL
jgi:predicted nuclease with RNAse H fold